MPRKIISRKLALSLPNKSICTQARFEISKTIPPPILKEYQINISSNINKFISNHKLKLQHLLDTSNTIQSSQTTLNIQTTHTQYLRVSCRHLNLEEDPDAAPFKIPSFIDIFRHLITLPNIINQFTAEELAELSRILALPVKHDIYSALDNSPVGNKLANVSSAIYTNLTTQFPTTDFHSLLFNSFTSYTILEQIETQMNHVSICTLTYGGKQYPNFLYIFNHGQPKVSKLTKSRIKGSLLDTLEINQIAENILHRVVFIGELINSKILPNRLIIFLTDAKKEIDDILEYQQHFRTLNVNTAVTNMHDIIIYRREELYKSIFHELIHFHNLDFKRLPADLSQMLLDTLHRTHNISPDNEYLLYEAITESLANTLNVIYLSKGIKEFQINLSREIMFSTFQVAKILRTCGYTNWNEFALLEDSINDVNINNNKNKQWRQDSCVFSYYVLKLYILLNLDSYWSHLLDSHLKFKTSKSHFSYLLGIFEEGRQNPKLKKIIDYLLLEEFNKASNKANGKHHRNKNNKKQTLINKTLRMTCLDG
jgi:hypothetical protein